MESSSAEGFKRKCSAEQIKLPSGFYLLRESVRITVFNVQSAAVEWAKTVCCLHDV